MLAAFAIAAAWCAACVATAKIVVPWLAARCGGDPVSGLFAAVIRVYCRVIHRAEFSGMEPLRRLTHAGPLIVVANHTAGIDPLLVQSAMQSHVRWMMDRRMMTPALDWLWRHERIIPVDLEGSDARAAIEAVRHLESGGVLGIFPEGGLARPRETINAFMPGIGLLVLRTNAPVLLCWISGTPDCERAMQSFGKASRSRVVFIELIRYQARTRPEVIVTDLRRRLGAVSGWPVVQAEPRRPR